MAGEFLQSLGSSVSGGGFLGTLQKLQGLEQAEYQRSLRPQQAQQMQNALTIQAGQLEQAEYNRTVLRPFNEQRIKDEAAASRARLVVSQDAATTVEEKRAGIQARRESAMEFYQGSKSAQSYAELNGLDLNEPAHQDEFILNYYKPMTTAKQMLPSVIKSIDRRGMDWKGGQDIKKDLLEREQAGDWTGLLSQMKGILSSDPLYLENKAKAESKAEKTTQATTSASKVNEAFQQILTGKGDLTQLNSALSKYNTGGHAEFARLDQNIYPYLRELERAGSKTAKQDNERLLGSAVKNFTDAQANGDLSAMNQALPIIRATDPTGKEYDKWVGERETFKKNIVNERVNDEYFNSLFRRYASSELLSNLETGGVSPENLISELTALPATDPLKVNLAADMGLKSSDPAFITGISQIAQRVGNIASISARTELENSSLLNGSNVVVGGSQVGVGPKAVKARKAVLGGDQITIDGVNYKANEPISLPGGSMLLPAHDNLSGLIYKETGNIGEVFLAIVPLVANADGARVPKYTPAVPGVSPGGVPAFSKRVDWSEIVPSNISAGQLKDMMAAVTENVLEAGLATEETPLLSSAGIDPVGFTRSRASSHLQAIQANAERAIKSNNIPAIGRVAQQLQALNFLVDLNKANPEKEISLDYPLFSNLPE